MWSLVALRPLRPFRPRIPLRPLCAGLALRPLGSLRPSITLWSLGTGITLRPLGSFRSSIPLWALWADLALRALGPGLALRPLRSLWSGLSLRSLFAGCTLSAPGSLWSFRSDLALGALRASCTVGSCRSRLALWSFRSFGPLDRAGWAIAQAASRQVVANRRLVLLAAVCQARQQDLAGLCHSQVDGVACRISDGHSAAGARTQLDVLGLDAGQRKKANQRKKSLH
ncbi:MAG: hypothetical protein EA370_04090 [Wenzhouxiangella sp.]|nr:MAG: hypothetical protein EA370_04090 [Wenzhouxiangella sp.]